MNIPKVGQVWRGKSWGGEFTVIDVTETEVEIEINRSGMTYAEDIGHWPSNDYELVRDVE